MMNTPICDFVGQYKAERALRLHMPGHKGTGLLGIESLDITEIQGADSLYEASGIIRASEENAGALFGCNTFYSTEGSSLCIRSMLYLCLLHAHEIGRKPLMLAGRNAHKAFLSGVALLDLDVEWLTVPSTSYLSCCVSAEQLETRLASMGEKPVAVYLTSPDYLGNCVDVRLLAEVCHRHGVLLVVDNAHGAYLHFLQPSMHPMDLGADLCCDSAHKTLPALTGAAYLHIANHLQKAFVQRAKGAMALFGSTSPSYLILQSLDRVNAYLDDGYMRRLNAFVSEVDGMKAELWKAGYTLCGTERLKLTIFAKAYGYTGEELGDIMLRQNIVYEFADRDYLVFMLTPENGKEGLLRLKMCLLEVEKRKAISYAPPAFSLPKKVLSVREALMSPNEKIPVSSAVGRILASPSVGCPPAVPILMCGEEIDEHAMQCFAYYGITWCWVVR